MKEVFTYGRYKYEYIKIKEDRKTLRLTVQPDLKIVLYVPTEANEDRIEDFLKRKWKWLEKQLSFFEKYQRKTYKKEYVSGENFLYLGRQYKLKVHKGQKKEVKLTKGVLNLSTVGDVRNKSMNKQILEDWYEKRREIKFPERYEQILNNFNYDFVPKLTVRKMKKRWGSFLTGKKIILNPELVRAPTECIDYVITHELCHMKYKRHSSDFYDFLELKMPDWERIKERLELLLV